MSRRNYLKVTISLIFLVLIYFMSYLISRPVEIDAKKTDFNNNKHHNLSTSSISKENDGSNFIKLLDGAIDKMSNSSADVTVKKQPEKTDSNISESGANKRKVSLPKKNGTD